MAAFSGISGSFGSIGQRTFDVKKGTLKSLFIAIITIDLRK